MREENGKALTPKGETRRSLVVGFANMGVGAELQEDMPKWSRLENAVKILR
jgi:hypothetical protein